MRTVKFYTETLSDEIIESFEDVSKNQQKLLNYCWNRFSGKKYLAHSDRDLRDVIFGQGFEKPSFNKSYVYDTVEFSKSTIKTNLEIAKKKIKKLISKNENLNEDEKHYLYFVFKNNITLSKIVNYEKIDYQDFYFKRFDKKINFHQMNNKARRYYRKYCSKIPKRKNSNTITISQRNYSYKDNNFNLKLNAIGSKRAKFKLTSGIQFNRKPNIVVKLDKINKRFSIHMPIELKHKKIEKTEDVIGIDLGITDLLVTSSGNIYGKNMSTLFYQLSDNITNSNKWRLRSLYKNYIESEDPRKQRKAQNILENNLGIVKYSRKMNRAKEQIKSNINSSINRLIESEKPKTIILEDLKWKSEKRSQTSKRQRNRFNTWMKGYLHERIEFKCLENGIEVETINPAYTSQICCKCDRLGDRQGKEFNCSNCNLKIDSDFNAAINIKKRKDIKEIDLFTPVKKIKKYYENFDL